MLQQIHKEVTDRDASIWWNPSPQSKDVYIGFHGKQKIAVNHHVEFNDLEPDTEYTFTMDDVELSFHTLVKKEPIDVTKEPYSVMPGQLCTKQLQDALDACDSTHAVYLPAGVYLTGALNMHSHSALYLEKGAVLQGTADPKDYEPRILSRFEGTERMCYRSLLNLGTLDHTSGPNCSDVLIYGHGEIRGGGAELARRSAAVEKENIQEYLDAHPEEVASCEKPETIPYRCRGRLINMSNCENIRITGLTLGYGPSWNIHFIYSAISLPTTA
jgi:exo-poly-alpha-galacturonosidase